MLKGKHVLKPYFLRLGNLEFFCTELTSWICISVNECNFSHFHHTVAIFRWNFNQTSSNKRSEQASSIQSMLQNSNGFPKRGSTFLLLIFDVIKYIESVQESRWENGNVIAIFEDLRFSWLKFEGRRNLAGKSVVRTTKVLRNVNLIGYQSLILFIEEYKGKPIKRFHITEVLCVASQNQTFFWLRCISMVVILH